MRIMPLLWPSVQSNGISYETQTEKALAELTKEAENEKYAAKLATELNTLREKLRRQKANDLELFKEEIKELLTLEIVQRYYFESGRTKASRRYDQDLIKAIEVLNTPSLYSKVLSMQWQIPRHETDVEGARFESEFMKEVREEGMKE